MWRGYEGALVRYGVAICDEWIQRGFRDTVRDKLLDRQIPDGPNPAWIGDEAIHSAHRASLFRKDQTHYGEFGWTDVSDGNVWPVT